MPPITMPKISDFRFALTFFSHSHFSDLVFFGLIFRPNFLGPTLTAHIFRTVPDRGAKFAAFVHCQGLYKNYKTH